MVIGIDVSALAASAKDAGYNVFSVDYFGDEDLRRSCKRSFSIVNQSEGGSCGTLSTDFSPLDLWALAKRVLSQHQVDAILLASGLEDFPKVLVEMNKYAPVIGNSPRIIAGVRDKVEFFQVLKRLSIRHPETILANNLEEAERAAKNINYPIVLKPFTGHGGIGVRKVESKNELETCFQETVLRSPKGVIIQAFVPGICASASFLSSECDFRILALTEQLLGVKKVGMRQSFGYCGTIVPYCRNGALFDTCNDLVDKLVKTFNLVGSNGVDLVVSREDEINVIEVNPRFQGSLECVEHITGINIVQAHMDACLRGALPALHDKIFGGVSVRLVLYAHYRSVVPQNLSVIDGIRDLPSPGIIVEEGEPLCSIVVEGRTRSYALKKATRIASHIYELVNQLSYCED